MLYLLRRHFFMPVSLESIKALNVQNSEKGDCLMKKNQIRVVLLVLLFMAAAGAGLVAKHSAAWAGPQPVADRADVIILGDRVVDIAYNLGVVPAAMSVRCSLWPMCDKLVNASQVLGCPNCVFNKKAAPVLAAARERGINRVIIEKHPDYCKYMDVSPEDLAVFLKDKNIAIEYVDFSEGLESAIYKTADLLNRKDKAESLIKEYKKQTARKEEKLAGFSKGGKVVILNGIYQEPTGRTVLRVEAPGGYADEFILGPLGWTNKGGAFQADSGKPSKGHYMVKKRRQGLVLTPLITAQPDVIVMTGDSFAVQKAISRAIEQTPELLEVPAVKNNAIYTLPAYVDASVIEYPALFCRWADALAR